MKGGVRWTLVFNTQLIGISLKESLFGCRFLRPCWTPAERERERDQKIEREVVEGGGAKEEDENEEGDNIA